MIIFKNGFPSRGFLQFKRRKCEYNFLSSNNYASTGKILFTEDLLSTDPSKGKVYSSILLKLYYAFLTILPKILYKNYPRYRSTLANTMANKFLKIELHKLISDSTNVINKYTPAVCISSNHNSIGNIQPGFRNCKISSSRNINCRFYSHVTVDYMTFGELLSKRKNIDSLEKNESLSRSIPTYMLKNSKYPSLAISLDGEKENAQTSSKGTNYCSFDLKDSSEDKNKVSSNINFTSISRTESQELPTVDKLSNDLIQYISVDKIPKNTLLPTLYEEYFTTKIYFVSSNKVENEAEVKVRKITRHLHPVGRITPKSDPVLKYLNFFRNTDKNLDSDKNENKLYLTQTEESNQKQGIREKSVPRDQLPTKINTNTQNIMSIINSIDRSEAIIHKDLYITNRIVDLLKKEDKNRENKKETLETMNRQSLSTNVYQGSTKTYLDQSRETESYGMNDNELLVGTKPIPSYSKENLTIAGEFPSFNNSQSNLPSGINPGKKLSSEYNVTNKLLSPDHNQAEHDETILITENKIYPKKYDSRKENSLDKLPLYDEIENNFTEFCKEDRSVYKPVITRARKEMNQTNVIKTDHLINLMEYLNNKNVLSASITIRELTKPHVSKRAIFTKLTANQENTNENDGVGPKNNGPVSIPPFDKQIGNTRDSSSTTNQSHFTYPPTFVDNIATNLRNPKTSKTQTINSQRRGSHSKSGHENSCTVDVLTETSITSTKFGERAKIQIHEVQTFKDRKLPIKFTTDTLMEMQGSNEKLRAATEIVEVAKAKLVLSGSSVDANVKSDVENAIKLAELLSFLKHKVLVGTETEGKKIPIEIERPKSEIKSIKNQTVAKSGSAIAMKTTEQINKAETNLNDKSKEKGEIQNTKAIKIIIPNVTDKNNELTKIKAKTDDPNKVDASATIKIKKDKKPEDEVNVIQVKSHDLKKILNRSDNTGHSIHIINNSVKENLEKDISKKKLHKNRIHKNVIEKKEKKNRLTGKKTGKRSLKKIFDIKPVVKNVPKKEAVERKTMETSKKNEKSDKKSNDINLTARDIKILENIKKGHYETPNSIKKTPVKEEAKSKLENVKGEKEVSQSLKNNSTDNKTKLSTSPTTYDIIKIPGDIEAKRNAGRKPPKKEKEVIIIAGEKENKPDDNERANVREAFKEKEFDANEKAKLEMVAVKELEIIGDNEVLQSYKNVFIKKTHRKPVVKEQSIPNVKDQKKQITSGQTQEEKSTKDSTNQSTTAGRKIQIKESDFDKLDSKTINDLKQSCMEMQKEIDKYVFHDKPTNKTTNIKPPDSKNSANIQKISPPVSKEPLVSAKDSKKVIPTAQQMKKDIKEEAGQKITIKANESSKVTPLVSKKPLVSAKDSKKVTATAQQMKKDIKEEAGQKITIKANESSKVTPLVSKKSLVSAKDSKKVKITGEPTAQQMKKDIKEAGQTITIKANESSKVTPPVSKKPEVSTKDSKKAPVQDTKKDLALEKKPASKKSSELSPLKKPEAITKGSKIPEIKQDGQDLKKELSSDKKPSAKVQPIAVAKTPGEHKSKGKRTLENIKQRMKESNKELRKKIASKKKSASKASKTSVTKRSDFSVPAEKQSKQLEKEISKKENTKSDVKLSEQLQNKTVTPADIKSKKPDVSKFASERSDALKKPKIKDQAKMKPKRKTTYSSPVIPISFAKSNSAALSEDVYIDLDKLSKETKPSLDVRGIRRSFVSLDKLMEFPLINARKSLTYEQPEEGIICLDCKKDPVLRQKLKNFPSVTRVLNATMSEGSRIALKKWRAKLIADLGEAGFQEFYKGQVDSGKEFHEQVQKHFSGHSQDLVNSSNPTLRSISSISKHITGVSVVESHVVHNELAYRGVIDCVAKFNNVPVLIEWKRSDKKKKIIQNTFDAPLQLCAYIGAMNFDTNYKMQVQGGIVVVAYSDGSPADVFTIPLEECQKYWKQWLARLKQYMLDVHEL